MKKRIVRIVCLLVLILMAASSFACGQAKNPSSKLVGTWYYVNKSDEKTSIFISFTDDGAFRLGTDSAALSVAQGELNDLIEGLFGDVVGFAKNAGLDLDISPLNLSEVFDGVLSMSYDAQDEEEIRITVTALKLINMHHTLQYSFKKNGDLVLGGMVFRKK